MEIRNIAIIAHVDHGKTTLTDAIMRQTGAEDTTQSMDSNALEQERGITIYAKNAAITYKGTKINIVDTPGHADFGSEVERVLRSIDTVLLIVDAQEGPMPQTRFVLKKSLELGLKPILILNKIDKPAADPDRAESKVFDLFAELGATDEQLDFTTLYAIGRDGIAKRALADESTDLTPLLDTLLEIVPPAESDESAPLSAQPFNLAYDSFLGRMAVTRLYHGTLAVGDTVFVHKENGTTMPGKITKLFVFEGQARVEAVSSTAGDIVLLAGLPDIDIGDTIVKERDTPPLPRISVDEPTIALTFLVNNSPFAGREGTHVTSRQIRERLERELEVNVGLKVDFSDSGGGERFRVYGRGELHIAILLEQMRREGYEVQVSQPEVIIKEIEGKKHEPFEEITVDVPDEHQGTIIEKLSARGAQMMHMESNDAHTRILFEGPTRGLLGFRNQFVVDTRGEGILTSRVIGFRPFAGIIHKRHVGSMVSGFTGKTLAFALENLQQRGVLYIGANVQVYEGIVIGNTAKGDELTVNPLKGKQLTNMRASGSDESVNLTPPLLMTIERGLEVMTEDEYLEITPKSVRLRKQFLQENERAKRKKKE
jgi:GTP-binding protein